MGFFVVFIMVIMSAPQKTRRKIGMTNLAVAKSMVQEKQICRKTDYNWRQRDDYKRKEGTGKSNEWDEKTKNALMECIEEDRMASLRKLETLLKEREFKKSKSAIGRFLKKMKWKRVQALRKPVLTKENKTKRVEWGRLWKDQKRCDRLILVDECCFKVEDKGKLMIWKSPQEKLEDLMIELPRRCKSVTGIGFVTWYGLVPIKLVDGGVTAEIYHQAVNEAIQWLAAQGASGKFQLIEDNCRIHKSKTMKSFWQNQSGGITIEVPMWPPYSPDLNPIENLWGALKFELHKKLFKSPQQLKKGIHDEWKKVDVYQCRNYLRSIPKRAQEVVSKTGNALSY